MEKLIATIAAGSRQQSRFISMMDNYERTIELVDAAQNSSGKSALQFAKYQETIEYKTNRLRNSWENLRVTFMNSDTFGTAIESLTKLLEIFNEFSLFDFAALGAIWMTFGKQAIQNFIGGVNKTVNEIGPAITKKLDEHKGEVSADFRKTKVGSFILGETTVKETKNRLKAELKQLEDFNKDKAKVIQEGNKEIFKKEKRKEIIDNEEIFAISSLQASGADEETINLVEAAIEAKRQDIDNEIKQIQTDIDNKLKPIDEQIIETQTKVEQSGKDLKVQTEEMKMAAEVTGTAISAALTAAISVGLTEDNPFEAVGTVLLSGLGAIIPQAISIGMATGKGFGDGIKKGLIASKVGIAIVAITAVVTGLYVGIKELVKDAGIDKQQQKLEELKKAAEEATQAAEEAKGVAIESKEAADNVSKLKEEFTELNQKQILSTEEQERYNELVQQIRSEYPEVVSYYNEVTGELQVQNQLWDNIIEKADILAKEDAKRAYAASIRAINTEGEYGRAQVEAKIDTSKLLENELVLQTDYDFFDVKSVEEFKEEHKELAQLYVDMGNDIDTIEDGWYDFVQEFNNLRDETRNELTQINQDRLNGLKEEQRIIQENIELQKQMALKNYLTNIGYDEAVANYVGSLPTEWAIMENTPDFSIPTVQDVSTGPAPYWMQDDLIAWKYLSDTQKEILKYTDYNTQELYNEARKSKESNKDIQDQFADAAETYYTEKWGEDQAELASKYSEELATFYSEVNTYTEEQLFEAIQKLTNLGFESLAFEDYKTERDNLVNTLAGLIFSTTHATSLNYSDWGATQLQHFVDEIVNFSEDTSIRREYGEKLHPLLKDLSPEVAGRILDIDEQNLSWANLEDTKQSFIKDLKDMGVSTEEATEIFGSYYQIVQDFGLMSISSSEAFIEGLNSQREAARENFNEILDIINSYLSEGELTIDQMNKLKELGYGDFIGENFEFDIEGAYNKYYTLVAQGGQITREQIESNEEKIDNLTKKLIRGELTEEERAAVIEEIELLNETNLELQTEITNQQRLDLQYIKESVSSAKELREEKQKAYEDAKNNWEEQQKAAEDAEKSYNEAIKAQQEAYYGTENYESGLDGLYNYEVLLKDIERQAEQTAKALQEVTSPEEAKKLFEQQAKNDRREVATLTAQRSVVQQSRRNVENMLLSDFGSYVTKVGDDLLFNPNYTSMMANDLEKKRFEELFQMYQEAVDKDYELEKTISEREKQRIEERKQYLEDYVGVQEEIQSILEEKAQEEIDITKDKYDALTEADNNYLDALEEAINKQRELREQENKYSDLAQQEKKLSLMQRDTSGANRAEVLSLEKEVQESRQEILDTEVDQMIEAMRELYETQQEARDAELEYLDSLMETTNWWVQVNDIIKSWGSAEDAYAWMFENNPEVENMTPEQLENYKSQIDEMYSKTSLYFGSLDQDVNNAFTNIDEAAAEVAMLVLEHYTTQAELLKEITLADIAEAQTEADEAVADAKEKWDEARDKVEDYEKEMRDAEREYDRIRTRTLNADSTALSFIAEASKKATKDIVDFGLSIIEENFTPTIQSSMFSGILRLAGIKADRENYSPEKDYQNNYNYIELIERAAKGTNSAAQAQALYADWIKNNNKVNPIVSYNTNSHIDPNAIHNPNVPGYLIETTTTQSTYIDPNVIHNPNVPEYEKGGLVNYTGPAWVDGTPSKPEAFLNAEDTKRIGLAAKILSNIPFLKNLGTNGQQLSSNVGDTSIEIHLNIEKLENDYDVEQMINKVKQEIVDVAQSIGNPVILAK